MSLSRVRGIEDIVITQPYAPMLFSQGDLPGRGLLLKYQRRQLDTAKLKETWGVRRKRDKPSKDKWPDAMELYCRGCSECVGEDVCKPLSEFDFEDLDTAWQEVVSKGMERFCRRCTSRASATENIELRCTGRASATENIELEDANTPDACAWCKKQIDAKMLAEARLEARLCTTCNGLRIKCIGCSKTLKKSITKPLSAFSFERLLKCKEQRTLSSRAKCLKCDDADPKTTDNLRAYHWQQASYNCSKCERELCRQQTLRQQPCGLWNSKPKST